ncbi:MAG: hypothetical protein ACOY94_26495 [Bacillota bacterium]
MMAAAPTPSRRTSNGVSDRTRSILGWIGVWLVTLVGSLVAAFAGGELVGSGVGGLGHVLQWAVIVGLGLLAVARPFSSVIYALVGLFILMRYLGTGGVILGGIPFIAGVLFFYGRPVPRQKAYRVMLLVPLIVGLVTAGIAAVLHITGLLPPVE